MKLPHVQKANWPTIRDGRFAKTISTESAEDCRIALLGLPDDLGVRLNHGRPGAAAGPSAFREALAVYGTSFDAQEGRSIRTRMFDAGDVIPVSGSDEKALIETHRRVEEAVGQLHAAKLTPICIGGGHDLTLPSVRALAKSVNGLVSGLNFDAHLDVRTTVGSGMPFRKLIEEQCLDTSQFLELGIGRFTCDESEFKWLKEQGGHVILRDQVKDPVGVFAHHFARVERGFVSIDLDGIDASQAPGVSAMNPDGLSAHDAICLANAAGRHPSVKHFDIMELSPPNDVQNRTARIAALIFLAFVAGFDARPR